MMRRLIATALLVAAAGCQSTYYAAAEKVGYHKREILVDRVEDARDAQADQSSSSSRPRNSCLR